MEIDSTNSSIDSTNDCSDGTNKPADTINERVNSVKSCADDEKHEHGSLSGNKNHGENSELSVDNESHGNFSGLDAENSQHFVHCLNSKKLKIPYPIIVEGKYDRLRLLSILDGNIIMTDGFGIFNKKEKTALLRRLAKDSMVILLTDSDGGGKLIRSHVMSCLPKDRIINLYTPEIFGKEKRKKRPGAEGKLGVEGMERSLLYKLFLPYTDENLGIRNLDNPLSKADFYADGLSGRQDSKQRRDEIARKFDLPSGMTANALLSALKMIATYEDYLSAVGRAEE